MKTLDGKIVDVKELSIQDKKRMFFLMDLFYDNMIWEVFLADLEEKDYCIVLFDDSNTIYGFSTQKIIQVPIDDQQVYGVFSGDTIVHKDYWNSHHPLFSIFGRFFETYSRDYDEFYWFIICKGYKTYKILPTFFDSFYPCYKERTPDEVQKVMDAFGRSYHKDYNQETGVVEYSDTKDKLRVGVADITERQMKNPHTAFFCEKNPHHALGQDLVCITSLKKYNYQKDKEAFLWG